MQTLKQLIKEFRELRQQATSAEWKRKINVDGIHAGSRNLISSQYGEIGGPRQFGRTEDKNWDHNYDFIVYSANNITKLLDAVEILVEGLEMCALDYVVAGDFREEYFLSVKNAKEALQQADEKVSKDA